MKKAFTLIEILISISILSIMMLFLYNSYSALNISNRLYKDELNQIQSGYRKKKTLFLDFSLAHIEKIKVLNQGTEEDVVFMQSSHSIHKRFNPYIAYFIQDSKLYRLESSHEFKEYPLTLNKEYIADYLGEVNHFRVYPSSNKEPSYLIHIDFKNNENILLKVKPLQNSVENQ